MKRTRTPEILVSHLKHSVLTCFQLLCLVLFPATHVCGGEDPSFTLEQVRGYPFPDELTAAATGSRLAWAVDERGMRNIWVAQGPEFTPRQLTHFKEDDGQELTSVSLSDEGAYVVFVRGGDHSSNWDKGLAVNPLSKPEPPKLQLWAAPFAGGEAKVLADGGDSPAVSPRGDRVAFVKEGQIWVAPVDGASPARKLFSARGTNISPVWSPDGSRLAFVSTRSDHAFIGIFRDESTPIRWIAPSTSRDGSPRWSPDGKRLVFIRRPGLSVAPEIVKKVRQPSWAICVASTETAEAQTIWKSPTTTRGAIPRTHGGANLGWAADDRIVFASYADGWPHLYSVPATGGKALLLTPGKYMAEFICLSPDRRYLLFAGNTGPDALDLDRRHVVKVPVDRAEPQVLTPGDGLEWSPVVTGDGKTIAFLSSTAQRPPLAAVMPAGGGTRRLLGEERIADFPSQKLVTPKQVIFKSPDGLEVHGQVFEASSSGTKKPAIVYVHGGPERQMLLGWHYSPYYENAYALNQYLASRGYVVLSVNYRRGIGYGYAFHHPANAGSKGAAEYQDIKAAGEYLRRLPQVDPHRIGIYGGSYGGYLTALALGRDSDLFAAGVDIHGVHRFKSADSKQGFAESDDEESGKPAKAGVAFKSSPIASVETWKSPVLLIHADDDRNVSFSHTVDLARRLAAGGVPFEEIVIPDDTHHFLRYENWLRVDQATAEFLDRKLGDTSRRAGP